MSNQLSDIDRELLGEVSHKDGVEATMAKTTGERGKGGLEDSYGIEFTPLNATAGTLVKVSSNGDELEPGNGNQDTIMEDAKGVPKTPKKRGAAAAANDDSSQPTKKRSPVKKASAATDGDATVSATPSKKRASPKKKDAPAVKVKAEDGEQDEEQDGETEGLEPVTPKQGKRATAKGKAAKVNSDVEANGGSAESTDKSVSPTKGNGALEGMTVHNTARKRQAPKKDVAPPRGIPTSWDEAGDADRMLVAMKEKGEGWAEIRTAWKEATGQDTAASTLPNRYNRLKVNMMRMKDGDEKHLLTAKKEVEDAYHANFWSNVSATMERAGANKYPAAFIQKMFRELEAAGKTDIDASTSNTAPATTSTSETKGAKDDAVAKEEETGDGADVA